jgi:hypothetical protein
MGLPKRDGEQDGIGQRQSYCEVRSPHSLFIRLGRLIVKRSGRGNEALIRRGGWQAEGEPVS